MPGTDDPALRLAAPVIPYKASTDGLPIERALHSLKKLDRIKAGKWTEQRASERFHYKSRPVVILPSVSDPSGDFPPVQVACTAWTRNLSSSGVSLVVPSSLMPISGIDDTVTCVDLNDASLEGTNAYVGLFGSNSKARWIESHIVWARALGGLGTSALELGMRFEDQHSREWPDASLLETLAIELRSNPHN